MDVASSPVFTISLTCAVDTGMKIMRTKTMHSFRWLIVAALLLATVIPGISNPPTAEEPMQIVELREIGLLKITPRFYGHERNRSAWVTMEARDARKAMTCASKYLADTLGFGEIKQVRDQPSPATVLSLEGTGWWVLGVEGQKFHILFAHSKEDLTGLCKRAQAAAWHPVERDSYPKWLDCFDNSSLTFWFSGFGMRPTDYPSDFEWCANQQFGFCTPIGNSERRLIAPGVVDTSVMDWYAAMARKYRIPYKMMAAMAEPIRSESLWNYAPLPHLTSAEGHIAAFPFYYERSAMSSSFQPTAATDAYTLDFRRRVSEQFKSESYLMGHHVMQEMPSGPFDILGLAAVAGTPEIQELWRQYVRNILKLDLKGAGLRYQGDAAAYSSWADLQIPSLKELAGWDPSVTDLKGTWEGRADRQKQAVTERWFDDGTPSERWKPVDSQDLGIMFYGSSRKEDSCDYWLRRKFTTSANSTGPKFLHMACTPNAPIPEIWINGKQLKLLTLINPAVPDWDLCFDADEAIQPGENLIAVNTKGAPIASYVFIGARGKWSYPGASEIVNRRYYDSIKFEEWLVMRELENRMIAIRSGDPNRPMKIMAPHNYMDLVMDLCARYGAYPHDTGSAGSWFAPFNYSRYARTRGLPNSAEQGSVPDHASSLQACMTRYLMTGVDMVDNVGHIARYSNDPKKGPWIAQNRELLRCIGKLDYLPPSIGILRSGRELRLGMSDIFQWDLGRGALPSSGRPFTYAELGDVKNGHINQYKILIDCATTVLADEEVTALENYVRQGGIFIAFHNTGMHTPEKAYAWPISRLTGLKVTGPVPESAGKTIRFNTQQNVWPALRGREVDGMGVSLDWKKQDRTGTPIAMEALTPEIQVVAEWKSEEAPHNIAIACRTIGKGKVITLGSTFWRHAKDEGGRFDEAGTVPYLDELLTTLGVPRETNAGELWAEQWRSKNGLYDVYSVAQMNSKAAPASTDVKLRRVAPITRLWEISALQHPEHPVRQEDGGITIPKVEMEAMQCRVYASPRTDIENAPLDWIKVQTRQWGKLAKIDKEDQRHVTVEPAKDVFPLIDNWLCATGKRDTSWANPDTQLSSEWKPVKLGSFAAMGLEEETIAQFRKKVILPANWAGQTVALHFNAENVSWGIGPKGYLWINGQLAAIKQPLKLEADNSFVIELTPEQTKNQVLVIGLEVDGRPTDQNQSKARPAGVTGSFFLQMTAPPAQTTALTEWTQASDLNVLTPANIGQKVDCMYLETSFVLPAQWPGRKLYLKSPVLLGSLFINNHYVAAPKWMHEIDISHLVHREGNNVLRWVPEKSEPKWNVPYQGTVPQMSLVWLP